MNARRVYVPQLDRETLLSLVSVCNRARLDARRELEDLAELPEGTHSDHLSYWTLEFHRLEAAHLWLLELLQRTP